MPWWHVSVEVWLHTFLALAVDGGVWSVLCHSHFSPHVSGTHCIGGWIGPRASLDAGEKSKIYAKLGNQLQYASCVVTEFIGELHIPSIQCVSCCLLDLHIQEGSRDEKQDIWGNTCIVQAWEWQVSGSTTDYLYCIQNWASSYGNARPWTLFQMDLGLLPFLLFW